MRVFIFSVLLLTVTIVNGQNFSKSDKEKFNQASDLFQDESFNAALVLFADLVKVYPNHFETNYYLGACYLNTRYSKNKAIPYLTKALEVAESTIPDIVHKDLGDLHHLTYNFDKAIYHYNKYLELAPRNDIEIPVVERMLTVCTNAKSVLLDTLNVNIANLGSPLNSDNSEFAPYISSDDSILFFTFKKFYTDEELMTVSSADTLSKLYVSIKENKQWTQPKEIKISGIKSESNVSIAGLSPDGEFLYINANNKGQQDIYSGRYLNDGELNLTPLPEPINSKYWEGKVSISAQGDMLWFSSNRPNGIGGKDIYKCENIGNNQWSEPINAGEQINTIYDEDAPFIHPSGNIFYFSSNGHNTIGGFDVFNILLSENQVFPAENMGFPINTTSNDMYFALTGNGEHGYFSSAFGNKYGNHDIYRVEMDLNIPLTIIKGTILAGDPAKPTAAKIRVIDPKSGKKLKYVYNPNPETGRYLLILPPGKDYNMIIESEEFLPQNIQIKIPEQKEFFELFQTIRLKPIISLGKQVGEQLEINNSFQAISKADTVEKDYDSLFNLIDQIITTTDTIKNESIELRGLNEEETSDEKEDDKLDELFSLIDEAFETGDTKTLNQLQENTITPDKFEQVFLYSENMEKQELKKVVLGSDTLYTSPELLTFSEYTNEKTKRNDLMGIKEARLDTEPEEVDVPQKRIITTRELRSSKVDDRRIILQHTFYFESNQYIAKDKTKDNLNEIAKLLVNNENLGLVVSGYTDKTGNEADNKVLSQKRTSWFIKSLKAFDINLNRAIIEYYGEEKAQQSHASAKDRRIDITIFELKQ